MNEDHDDQLQQLRALDPAAGVQASESLRQRVNAITESASGAPVSPAPRRWRNRWLMPVAAVTIAATAFSTGALLTAGGESGPETTAQDASTVPLETLADGAIAPPVHLGTPALAGDGSMAAPTTGTGAQDFSLMTSLVSPWGQRRHFTFPAFDDAAGETTVYAVDNASRYGEVELVRIAAVFGVEGVPVNEDYQGWRIGDQESVSLSARDGSFSFSSRHGDPVSDCVSATGQIDQATYDQCLQQVPMPTEEESRSAMVTLLTALGIDEDDVLMTIDDSPKLPRTQMITASRIVEEKATPVVISAYVTHEGIVSAYGALGDIVPVGDYDIVSPAEAAQRLNTSAFAPQLVSPPDTVDDSPVIDPAPAVPPPVPTPGSAVPWGISEHTIVSARLGLSTINAPDASVYIVPAYEFTDTERNTWSVIALAQSELDTAANVMNTWF